MLENVILAVIIVLALGGAALYIYKAKKKGKKCIGCPGKCCECNGSCGTYGSARK